MNFGKIRLAQVAYPMLVLGPHSLFIDNFFLVLAALTAYEFLAAFTLMNSGKFPA
jgi:hypothetical protein